MIIVADTNVILRWVQPSHPMHPLASDSTELLRKRGHELCVFPQCLYEFWVVATRPVKDHGLGLEMPNVVIELNRILALFTLLTDISAVFPEWIHLVCTHNVKGKPAHDARIAAAMNVHAVTHLLTFNDRDFTRYPTITVLTPAGVLAGAHP